MKNIITLFISFFLFGLNAQTNVPSWVSVMAHDGFEDYYLRKNNEEKDVLKNNHIQSRTSIIQNKKRTTKIIDTYNKSGHLLTHEVFDENNNRTSKNTYTYDNQNRITSMLYHYKNKKAWQEISYDKSGTLIRSKGYTYKGEYKGREEFKREDGKYLAITIWSKDSISPLRRLTYDYYEDGTLKQIKYHYKSQLKYTWNYDCKPEGELEDNKQKELTTICISEEYDENGNLIKWHRQFNSKGEVEKRKLVFENDTTLLYEEVYDIDDRLTSRWTYFKDGGYLYFSYNKKGKVVSTNETIYNTNKQLVRRFYAYKNFYSNTWYEYEGDLIKTMTTMKRNQTTFTEYSYLYFN